MSTSSKREDIQAEIEKFFEGNWDENEAFLEIQEDEDSDDEDDESDFIPELEKPWYTKNFTADEIAKFLTENLVTDDFIDFVHKKIKTGDINLRDLQRTILVRNKCNVSDPSKASVNNNEGTIKRTAACFEHSSPSERNTEETLQGSASHCEPDTVLETLYHKYDNAVSEKDYYEAARLCRFMLSYMKLEVRSGQLSHTAGLKFQEGILQLYSDLIDDVSDDGVHNYLEAVQLMANASNPQCSDWKSGLSSITKEDFLQYLSEDSVTNNIYPLSDSEDETEKSEVSNETIINEFYERIDKALANCSLDALEEAFGKDTEYFFDNPDVLEDSLPKIEKKTATVIPDFFNPKQKSHLAAFMKSNKLGLANRDIPRSSDDMTYETETKNTFKRKKLAKESECQEPCTSVSSQKPAFATAKDVFHEQQNKNKGFNNSRKCLGTRRGPGSKFVTPFHNPDEDDEKQKTKSENSQELQDERLKGIDPKMVEVMLNEIMDHDSPVSWDDIAGLEFVKTTLKEIVVWPMLRPDIFKGLRAPPKGILLFGPPGTGKTLIGKCVASQSKSTFFSISASSLGSKWYGEGEKLVRALFTVAQCYQPAVIFIDEIDSLLTQRSDNDHESSRRVKTEFLVQLDGVKTTSDERLLIIGATNRPQELDEAARRRLVKRLYIPLPEPKARIQIVKTLLADHNHELSDADFETLKAKTDGYSGADMANLCKEAALGPIRCINLDHIASITNDQVRPIRLVDFIKALTQVRASVGETDLNLYEQWNKKYGSNFSEANIC